MKVKLLKKLRKRFFWFRKPNYNFWFVYDRELNQENYSFSLGLSYYMNDHLIYLMLKRLNLNHLYENRGKRVSRLKDRKAALALKNKYAGKFK